MNIGLIASTIIFVITYGVILSKKVERSLAAVTGGVLMVITGLYFGFYTEHEVITEAIDWNTIGLLLGMMLIVGILQDTGLFETIAIWAAKVSRGDYFYMIVLFGLVTSILSTTIDNVTTILLVAPISLSITSVLGIDPRPILLSEALFSDTAGVATLVGNPPNIMISGAAGFHYMDYIYNLAPTVILSTVVVLIVFKFIFADTIRDENEKINSTALNDIVERKPTDEIEDWNLLKKSLVALGLVIVLFILQNTIGITPATVALTGAALLLVLAKPDMEEIVDRVEWDTLLFFAGLFVVVHGVANTGLLALVAHGVIHLTSGSLIFSTLAVVLLTAAGSAFVYNIPFTAMMIPIVATLSSHLTASSDILWWALAFGSGFGGNAMYIGSSANIMIVKMSEDAEVPITARYWLKYGGTFALVTLTVASFSLIIQILTPIKIPLLPF